jgi:hypothetical protein
MLKKVDIRGIDKSSLTVRDGAISTFGDALFQTVDLVRSKQARARVIGYNGETTIRDTKTLLYSKLNTREKVNTSVIAGFGVSFPDLWDAEMKSSLPSKIIDEVAMRQMFEYTTMLTLSSKLGGNSQFAQYTFEIAETGKKKLSVFQTPGRTRDQPLTTYQGNSRRTAVNRNPFQQWESVDTGPLHRNHRFILLEQPENEGAQLTGGIGPTAYVFTENVLKESEGGKRNGVVRAVLSQARDEGLVGVWVTAGSFNKGIIKKEFGFAGKDPMPPDLLTDLSGIKQFVNLRGPAVLFFETDVILDTGKMGIAGYGAFEANEHTGASKGQFAGGRLEYALPMAIGQEGPVLFFFPTNGKR